MGRLSADGMAEAAPRGIGLMWHLQSNHYPPVSSDWVPTCEAAIDLANEGGDLRELIDVPDGYGKPRPAIAIIEALHLDSWIELEETWD